MEIEYKQKYLKYKQKYLNLKNQLGGTTLKPGKSYIFFFNSSIINNDNVIDKGTIILKHFESDSTQQIKNPSINDLLKVIQEKSNGNSLYHEKGSTELKVIESIITKIKNTTANVGSSMSKMAESSLSSVANVGSSIINTAKDTSVSQLCKQCQKLKCNQTGGSCINCNQLVGGSNTISLSNLNIRVDIIYDNKNDIEINNNLKKIIENINNNEKFNIDRAIVCQVGMGITNSKILKYYKYQKTQTAGMSSPNNLQKYGSSNYSSPNNLQPYDSPNYSSPNNLQPYGSSNYSSPNNLQPYNSPNYSSPNNLQPYNSPNYSSPNKLQKYGSSNYSSPNNLQPYDSPNYSSPNNLQPYDSPNYNSPNKLQKYGSSNYSSPNNLQPYDSPNYSSPNKLQTYGSPNYNSDSSRKLFRSDSLNNATSSSRSVSPNKFFKSPRNLFRFGSPSNSRSVSPSNSRSVSPSNSRSVSPSKLFRFISPSNQSSTKKRKSDTSSLKPMPKLFNDDDDEPFVLNTMKQFVDDESFSLNKLKYEDENIRYAPLNDFSYVHILSKKDSDIITLLKNTFENNWVLTGSVAIKLYLIKLNVNKFLPLETTDIDAIYKPENSKLTKVDFKWVGDFERKQELPHQSVTFELKNKVDKSVIASFDLSCERKLPKFYPIFGINVMDPVRLLEDYLDNDRDKDRQKIEALKEINNIIKRNPKLLN